MKTDKLTTHILYQEFLAKNPQCFIDLDNLISSRSDVRLTIDDVVDGKMKYKFGKIDGDFRCSYCRLTTLEGGPYKVMRSYNCVGNKLTSLEGCPKYVGDCLYCWSNTVDKLQIPKDQYFRGTVVTERD